MMVAPSFHERFMPTGGMRQNPGQSTRGDLMWNPITRENSVINQEWLDSYMAPQHLIIVSPTGTYRYVETNKIMKSHEADTQDPIISTSDYISFLNRPTWNGVQYETAGHETGISYEAAAQSHTIQRQMPQMKDMGDMGLTIREEEAMVRAGRSSREIEKASVSQGILQANANYIQVQYEKGINDAMDLIRPEHLTLYEAEDKLDSVKLPEDNFAYSEGFIFVKKLLDETYHGYDGEESPIGVNFHPLAKTMVNASDRTRGNIDGLGNIENTKQMVIKR
jgi:hypothetical protein